MSDPATPILATGGLTIFGIVTGIHPMLLVAGFVGCWWYNSYLPELHIGQRIISGLIASFVAAWLTPPIVTWAISLDAWPPSINAQMVGFPAALAFGFLTHRVIGPWLLKAGQKKLEDIA